MASAMVQEVWHKGGVYENAATGVQIGWVTHCNTSSGSQLIWNETKDVGLVLAGECFPDPRDIEDLQGKGHRVDAEGASYLVHLYEEFGSGFLERVNGWFSGVLIDLRKQTIALFNDRYGLNRIYFHENSEGFYFATEAKALLRILPHLRRLDPRSLGEVLTCGCALQNRTLFSGVSLLPPGSMWTCTRGQEWRKESYFSKAVWEEQTPLDCNEFHESLKATFSRVLPRYLRRAPSIAMSLTGGLDGRLIMAWAGCAPGTMPCYTFGGLYRDSADVAIARQIAHACRQSHEVISVDRRFLGEFPKLAARAVYGSDGAMDVTGAVNLYANRIAQDISPVRLTGNYGSEILRGCVALRPRAPNRELFSTDLSQYLDRAESTYAAEARGHRLSFIAFKQIPWHHGALFAVEQSQMALRSPYLDAELVGLMYRAHPSLISSVKPSLWLIREGNPVLSRIPTDHGIIQGRIPMQTACRRLWQDFTLKAEYAYDSGMPSWLAKIDRAMGPLHGERLFLGRHKFTHFRTWYRRELSEYIRDILLDSQTLNREFFQRPYLESMVNNHTRGICNHTDDIHRALTLELIQRHLIAMN